MNIHALREAQVRFEYRLEEIIESRNELHRLRAEFVHYFNPDRILIMDIDDYVLGVDIPENEFNFCYTLERQLDKLGRILGAPAFKFGVYYGKTKSDQYYKYRFTKKFGKTYQEAFNEVKQAILKLLEAGEKENIDAITKNILSPMLKGKILATYFPERYLNVFSKKHLIFFLTQFNLDTEKSILSDEVIQRELLIKYKNQDPVMCGWSVDLFSHFLYAEFPGSPPKTKDRETTKNDLLAEYRMPLFPPNPKAEFITLNILSHTSLARSFQSRVNSKGRGNSDYVKEAKELKELGDRGEKIVMDLEDKRLNEAGRIDLAKKIKRMSLISDSFGYDIRSFEVDGKYRYIEVKATRSKVGKANFFLTANELKTALEKENYFIYMVYDVISDHPKIWAINNPFNPENRNVVKTPINYRVTINAAIA